MITLFRCAIVLVLLGSAAVHAQSACTVHGRLVSDDSGDPIRNGRITFADECGQQAGADGF